MEVRLAFAVGVMVKAKENEQCLPLFSSNRDVPTVPSPASVKIGLEVSITSIIGCVPPFPPSRSGAWIDKSDGIGRSIEGVEAASSGTKSGPMPGTSGGTGDINKCADSGRT